MPKYIKIGLTQANDVDRRIRDLDNTSVPLPFECYYAALVDDCRRVEKLLHHAFDDYRARSNREFFYDLNPEQVKSALLLAEVREVTPSVSDLVVEEADKTALNIAKTRKRARPLEAIGVTPGCVLTFAKDAAVTCTVTDNNRVILDDETYSISKAALIVLRRMGYEWSSVNGYPYWLYQGRTLSQHYGDLEEQIE